MGSRALRFSRSLPLAGIATLVNGRASEYTIRGGNVDRGIHS